MCGRYTLRKAELLRAAFDAVVTPSFEEIFARPRFNIAPSQAVAVVRPDAAGHRSLGVAKWGLVPHWSGPKPKARPINARAETVPTSPMFRQAFARRRCLMPADGFYEWRTVAGVKKPVKQPFFIRMKSDEPFAFAGLWERWHPSPDARPVDTCAQITTTPNELMQPIHDRMPVILKPEDYDRWLDRDVTDVTDLLRPYDTNAMEAWPVSPAVNKATGDDASMVRPAEEPLVWPGQSGETIQPDAGS